MLRASGTRPESMIPNFRKSIALLELLLRQEKQ
jgi:hypothetical protein